MTFIFVAIALAVAALFGIIPFWLAVAGAVAALAFEGIGTIVTIRRLRVVGITTGVPALVGKRAVVRTPLAPSGYIFIGGERWAAEIEDGRADIGDHVRITGHEGFRLRVRREE